MFERAAGTGYRLTGDHRPKEREMARDGSKSAQNNLADFPDGPPDATGLTPRQHKVLDVIRDSVERRGYPPSMREIGEAVGLTSTSSVAHQLATLQRKGFLRRDPNRPRAVDVRLPAAADSDPTSYVRSEERRVGKEC